MKLVRSVKAQSRHPLQITSLLMWSTAGAVNLIFPQANPNQQLDPLTLKLVCVQLLVAGLICLGGSLINDVILGLALELIGWFGISVAMIVALWGMAVIASHGWWTSLFTIGVFVVGSICRITQIFRAITRLRQLLKCGAVNPEDFNLKRDDCS